MTERVVLILALLAPALAGAAAPPPTTPAAPTAPAQTSRPAAPTSRPAPQPTPKPVIAPVLEGTVKGPDAKPIEGALVLCRALNSNVGELPRTARTDAAGRFRVEMNQQGLVAVRIEAAGLAAQLHEKVDPRLPLAVRLERGGAITGIVQDERGRPVLNAQVEASSALAFARSPWEEDGQLRTMTDSQGRFRLEGVGSGLYTVAARARGLGSASQADVVAGGRVKLLLRSGGLVTGVVTDVEGRPVEHALVRAEMEGRAWKTSQVERSDRQGRFDLLGLENGSYTVTARHPDFASAVATSIRVERDGASETTLVLAPGTTVIGRLLGPEERPATGRVFMQELAGLAVPGSLSESLRTEADSLGRFRLDRVPAGTWVLAVMAPGFAGQTVEAEASGKEPLLDLGDIVLDPGLTIRGRVHAAGDLPVANARITAFPSDPLRLGSRAEAKSDADGMFTLAGLRPGLYRLSLWASGFAGLNRETLAPAEGVDFELTTAGSVTGVVVDEAGRPVTAYRIAVHNTREGDGWGQGARTVGSDDGRFEVDDVKEGIYVVEATAPDKAPGAIADVRVVSGRTIDVGSIRLRAGGIVRGVVTDASGSPISTATVRVGGPGMDGFDWPNSQSAMTDATGAFEVHGVRPGAQSVVAEHPSYAPGEAQTEVDPAKAPAEVRIVLLQGGRVEGSARTREGSPIADARVYCNVTNRRDYGFELPETSTRADGTFSLEHLPPGPSLVALMMPLAPGRSTSSLTKQVDVHDGETVAVDFVARETLVTGRVTRARVPLAGVALRLFGHGGMTVSTGGASMAAGATGPQRRQAVTRDDGSFELIVDEPGTYHAQVQSLDGRMRFPMRELEIPDRETFVLDLAFAGASITGSVVDKDTGAPISRASVRASPRDRDRGWSNGRTLEDGRFELEVEPGVYEVVARAEGYASGGQQATVDLAGAPELRLELAHGLAIAGRLLDATGRPVSGLQVGAILEDGSQSEYATSLPDGSFRIDGLASSGRWNLAAGSRLAGYGVRAGVEAGEKDITLTLRRGGVVRLLVLKDGAPLTGAWASVERVGGVAVTIPDFETEAITDMTGQTELGAPPGTVEIEVANPTHKGSVRVSVSEGGTTAAQVKLTEALKLK